MRAVVSGIILPSSIREANPNQRCSFVKMSKQGEVQFYNFLLQSDSLAQGEDVMMSELTLTDSPLPSWATKLCNI